MLYYIKIFKGKIVYEKKAFYFYKGQDATHAQRKFPAHYNLTDACFRYGSLGDELRHVLRQFTRELNPFIRDELTVYVQ